MNYRSLRLKKTQIKKFQFTKLHYIIAFTSILLIIFLVSLISYLTIRGDRSRIVLFFPDKFTGKLIGEERYIKKENNRQDILHTLISELLLGPSLPGSSPVFSRETEIISTLLINTHFYINFSKEIIFPDIKIPLDFYTGLSACINSIKFNFPWVKSVSFYVNGEIITLQPGENSDQEKDYKKIRFRSDLLK